MGDFIKSQAEHASMLFDRYKHDPLEELIAIAQDPDLAPKDKIRINEKILEYKYPKLKAVEIDAVMETKIIVNIARFSTGTVEQTIINERPIELLEGTTDNGKSEETHETETRETMPEIEPLLVQPRASMETIKERVHELTKEPEIPQSYLDLLNDEDLFI